MTCNDVSIAECTVNVGTRCRLKQTSCPTAGANGAGSESSSDADSQSGSAFELRASRRSASDDILAAAAADPAGIRSGTDTEPEKRPAGMRVVVDGFVPDSPLVSEALAAAANRSPTTEV